MIFFFQEHFSIFFYVFNFSETQMEANRKKTKKHGRRKWEEKPKDDTPFFAGVNQQALSKHDIYAEGDSGSESDEEHLLIEAKELEKRQYDKIKDSSAFSTIALQQVQKPIFEKETLQDIESTITAKERSELHQTVRTVLQDLTDASRELMEGDFNNSKADQARRQILYQLVTDASYFLYIIASGYSSSHHPVIQYMNHFKNVLEGEQSNEEEQVEEEEYTNENIQIEPEKHIPDQLRKVDEGLPRFASNQLLRGRDIRQSKPKWRKNARQAAKKHYARAAHIQRQLHPTKELSKDGIYRGERGGIDPNRIRSTSSHPAH